MDASDFNTSFYTRPGMRAQLVDKNKGLITDFILKKHNIEESQNKKEFDVIHALNISSPGWTSAFPFADRIVSELMGI